MRAPAGVLAILVLAVTAGGCGPASHADRNVSPGQAARDKVDCEDAARRAVEAHIEQERVDASGLEFYFAQFRDTLGKQTTFAGEFGPRVWTVKYGHTRGPGGLMTAGAGMLFYVDARTGQVIVWRERD